MLELGRVEVKIGNSRVTVPLRFFLDKALVAIDHVEMPHHVILSCSSKHRR